MTKSNIPHFQSVTNVLAQKFRTFYEQYYLIKDWLNLSEGQIRLIERRKSLIDRLEQPEFPVAFLGSFSAGKSTIINAFIGRDLLPESTKALTAIPTIIRSGVTDSAIVHFLNKEERVELFNLWVKEISTKLNKPFPVLTTGDVPKSVLLEVTKLVQELGDSELNVNKELGSLKKLVSKWDEHPNATSIQFKELPTYVTDQFSEYFLINRVEVTVAGIDMPSGMVLVDLPGLNVANPLHKKITKDFVEKEAKAFIVCLKPDHLMEGDEIKLLDEINQQTPQFLKRAFWLVNKWELQDEIQQKQIRATFYEKIQDHGFEISDDRRFEVSALNYLLVNAIASGAIKHSPQLQGRTTNLEKLGIKIEDIKPESLAKIIAQHKTLQNFSGFEKSLNNYLAGPALTEFINGAQQELAKLLNIVVPELERMVNQYINQGFTEEDLQIGLVTKGLQEIKSTLKKQIDELQKEVRIDNFTAAPCWDSVVVQEIKTRISNEIQNLKLEDILSALAEGADRDWLKSNLPYELNKRLKIDQVLREKLCEQVADNYILKLMEEFFTRLDSEVQLPADFYQELRQLLGASVVYSRIEGLADALFYDYGETIDQIGLEKLAASKLDKTKFPSRDYISSALAVYESGLQAYLIELAPKVNQMARRSAKNFVESTFLKIEPLFEIHTPAFTASIRKNLSFDESLKQEQIKRETLIEVLENFRNLKQS